VNWIAFWQIIILLTWTSVLVNSCIDHYFKKKKIN
jgi:hypothetical protein